MYPWLKVTLIAKLAALIWRQSSATDKKQHRAELAASARLKFDSREESGAGGRRVGGRRRRLGVVMFP